LWTRGTETLGAVIFNYEDGGYSTLYSAMSILSVLATLALMGLLHVLGPSACGHHSLARLGPVVDHAAKPDPPGWPCARR
jgi:hypothetical protein